MHLHIKIKIDYFIQKNNQICKKTKGGPHRDVNTWTDRDKALIFGKCSRKNNTPIPVSSYGCSGKIVTHFNQISVPFLILKQSSKRIRIPASNMNNRKIIVFTDLDGTLLDHVTYSFCEAEDALELLREKEVPLILCSSKSSDEIKVYRRKLSNNEPFISENGGAIFIPEGYGNLKCEFNKIDDGYLERKFILLIKKISDKNGKDIDVFNKNVVISKN